MNVQGMNNPFVGRPILDHVPVGSVIAYAGVLNSTGESENKLVSSGWMVCNGRSLSVESYPELFAALAYQYGGADGLFNIPNLCLKSSNDDVNTESNKLHDVQSFCYIIKLHHINF